METAQLMLKSVSYWRSYNVTMRWREISQGVLQISLCMLKPRIWRVSSLVYVSFFVAAVLGVHCFARDSRRESKPDPARNESICSDCRIVAAHPEGIQRR